MLGNIICWMFALCLMLMKTPTLHDWYIRIAFALGFIFVGTLCKAVEVYRIAHEHYEEENKNQTT